MTFSLTTLNFRPKFFESESQDSENLKETSSDANSHRESGGQLNRSTDQTSCDRSNSEDSDSESDSELFQNPNRPPLVYESSDSDPSETGSEEE